MWLRDLRSNRASFLRDLRADGAYAFSRTAVIPWSAVWNSMSYPKRRGGGRIDAKVKFS